MCNLSWTHKFSLDFKHPGKGPVQYLGEREKITNTAMMVSESLGVFPHRFVRKYCFCCPQMLTKFCGHPHAPGMSRDGPFHCRVRFEGPNVIEGLRNLASAGAMSVPLKTHLAKIHTSARSVFMLKNKDRRQRSSQTSTSSQHTPASQLLSHVS